MDVNPDEAPVTKEDLNLVKGDLTLMRSDLMQMRGDMTLMRSDLTQVQGDMTLVRGDLTVVKDDLKSFTRKFALEIVKIHASDERRDELNRAEMRALSSNIKKQIDGYMSEVGKVDRAQIIADWRMTQLEGRVDKIESRPS